MPPVHILNKTDYATDDLLVFFRKGLAALGARGPRFIKVFATNEPSAGIADVGTCSVRFRERGKCEACKITLILPPPSKMTLRRLARLFEHEVAHTLGKNHGPVAEGRHPRSPKDMTREEYWSLGPTPRWARGTQIRFQGRPAWGVSVRSPMQHNDDHLLAHALRDWRSGRAFVRGKAHTYWLKPIVMVAGVKAFGNGRAKKAPWSDAANRAWGASSQEIHRLANLKYPREDGSSFEQMRGMDRVRSRLLQEGSPRPKGESAVKPMQLYLGSVDWASVRDQDKLYRRAKRAVDAICKRYGMEVAHCWNQVEAEAKRRGPIRPMPGKDFWE